MEAIRDFAFGVFAGAVIMGMGWVMAMAIMDVPL